MLRLLAACAMLVAASPAFAEDKPKPNTLTPKEIADGWILLFDGETTFGWKIDGAAEVKDGQLVLGKGKKTFAYPTTRFGDKYQVDLTVLGKARVHLAPGICVVDTTAAVRKNLPCDIHFKMLGKDYSYVADENVSKREETKEPRPELAHAPFVIETDGTSEVAVSNVKVGQNATTPLFGGKSLDGWKVNAADPKRMASKFELTKDGELSVKNGPGDLVTEQEF